MVQLLMLHRMGIPRRIYYVHTVRFCQKTHMILYYDILHTGLTLRDELTCGYRHCLIRQFVLVFRGGIRAGSPLFQTNSFVGNCARGSSLHVYR